jgi:1,4-dihydroxy-6-naphthoate synthase
MIVEMIGDPPMPTAIRVAHSPDSDDVFMFHGLASGAVPAPGFDISYELRDIETLNHAATRGLYEITALSVHAYAHLAERWLLLPAGASFGDGYGPAIVVPASSKVTRVEDLAGARIAVPGRWTSASLALGLRLPAHEPVFMDFKAVGDAAKRGEVQAGLVIHEGQLTAAEEGLRVVEDLGRWWKGRTGLPLPLGMNAIRRDLPEPVRRALAGLVQDSVAWGLDHREQALDRAMEFARGLPREKADRFVGMYVNAWTRDVGAEGRRAIARFLGEAADAGLCPRVVPEYQER